MKNEKTYTSFLITKIWQILKRFSRPLSSAETSYFWSVVSILDIGRRARHESNTGKVVKTFFKGCFIFQKKITKSKVDFWEFALFWGNNTLWKLRKVGGKKHVTASWTRKCLYAMTWQITSLKEMQWNLLQHLLLFYGLTLDWLFFYVFFCS